MTLQLLLIYGTTERRTPTKETIMELKDMTDSKLNSWLVLGYEKLADKYGLSIEELKASVITIKDGEVTVKTKGKK